MKLIITESQYRRLIESEEEEPKLYNFSSSKEYKIYKDEPELWDDIFLRKKKKDGINYTGYYIKDNIIIKDDVTELEYLVKVDGDLDLTNSKIKSLPMLSEVSGRFDLSNNESIKSLPELVKVGIMIDLYGSNVTSLPKLKEVGNIYLKFSKIESLPSLKKIGGGLYLSYENTEKEYPLKNLPKLREVGFDFVLSYNRNITSLPSLEKVGGGLDCFKSTISDLSKLESVGFNLDIGSTYISELPKLNEVKRSFYLSGTPLLRKLEEEGMGHADIKKKYGVVKDVFY
jgi:hypothetical protein